jgi:hypothetical protein
MGFLTVTHEVPPRVCGVADQDCKAPPNCDPPAETRAECFACGQPVCTNCSRRRTYMSYGVRRVCADCAEMHGLGP